MTPPFVGQAAACHLFSSDPFSVTVGAAAATQFPTRRPAPCTPPQCPLQWPAYSAPAPVAPRTANAAHPARSKINHAVGIQLCGQFNRLPVGGHLVRENYLPAAFFIVRDQRIFAFLQRPQHYGLIVSQRLSVRALRLGREFCRRVSWKDAATEHSAQSTGSD